MPAHAAAGACRSGGKHEGEAVRAPAHLHRGLHKEVAPHW